MGDGEVSVSLEGGVSLISRGPTIAMIMAASTVATPLMSATVTTNSLSPVDFFFSASRELFDGSWSVINNHTPSLSHIKTSDRLEKSLNHRFG